jgi:tol-pal system protein YbgF
METEPAGPLDLSGVGQRPLPPASSAESPGPASSAPTRTAGLPGPAVLVPGGATLANAPPSTGGPREQFDAALSYLREGEYATAQTSLESFIQKYPKDRLVADAVFYLGETYFQRGRHREAAEQYLKVATDYARSPRAPEGLVRLGMSLNALGAKEQACATFGEVGRKYPNASAAIKASVEREIKRAKC